MVNSVFLFFVIRVVNPIDRTRRLIDVDILVNGDHLRMKSDLIAREAY